MDYIKIGDVYLRCDDIIGVHADYVQIEPYSEELPDGGIQSGTRAVHYVRLVTRAVEDCQCFKHGTPEAGAIMKWVKMRALTLV